MGRCLACLVATSRQRQAGHAHRQRPTGVKTRHLGLPKTRWPRSAQSPSLLMRSAGSQSARGAFGLPSVPVSRARVAGVSRQRTPAIVPPGFADAKHQPPNIAILLRGAFGLPSVPASRGWPGENRYRWITFSICRVLGGQPLPIQAGEYTPVNGVAAAVGHAEPLHQGDPLRSLGAAILGLAADGLGGVVVPLHLLRIEPHLGRHARRGRQLQRVLLVAGHRSGQRDHRAVVERQGRCLGEGRRTANGDEQERQEGALHGSSALKKVGLRTWRRSLPTYSFRHMPQGRMRVEHCWASQQWHPVREMESCSGRGEIAGNGKHCWASPILFGTAFVSRFLVVW